MQYMDYKLEELREPYTNRISVGQILIKDSWSITKFYLVTDYFCLS